MSLQNKRMKRITNILSYLCLLLLLLVVACSDLEEIVVNMQGEEEVELTIQTNIPSLGGSTRSVVDAENITSITALAFDSDKELIKVAIEDVTISPSATPSTSGTYTVKVPVRTRHIHFIAKNGDAEFTEITNDDYGKSDEYLLKDRLATELHYWGKLDFDDAEDLTTNVDGDDNVTLYRNMAKLTLQLPNGTSGYIAGFLNYNTDGTIAAYSGDDFNYHTEKTSTHYLPATHTDSDEDDKYKNAQTKPIVQYLFEEENANGDYVYAICNIADKYYKIAFAYADANDETVYFPIVRNHSYTINIKKGYSTAYGKDSFESAIDAAPINATAQEEVEFIFDSETIIMFIEDRTCEISVTIPEGITQLKVLPASIFTIQSIQPELNADANGLYPVTPETYTFTLLLDENHKETGRALVQFFGEGVGKIAHKDVEVKLRKKATLIINPEEQTLINTLGSFCYVDVTIPANINNLMIEAGEAFTVTSVATLSSTPVSPNDDGSYSVTNTTYRVTLTLKDDAVGQIGEKLVHFAGTSEYWGAEGSATIELIEYVAEDLDVYEMWFDNNNTWNGSQEYNTFFSQSGEITTGNGNAGNMRETFYDALAVNGTTYSADNHKQQAMVMGSDDSFTFTIPAGGSRWLTMLVAADGGNKASINLQKDDAAYTKETAEDLANGTYNFGAEGEITSAGRLIRYELPAGTYTLKGSDAAYLLYYMRVSTERPTMTDVAQPQLTDYTLSWSGATYTNKDATGHLPIDEDNKKHIVDENNLTHTVSLKPENSLTSSLNLSPSSKLAGIDLVVETTRVAFTNENENTYDKSTSTQSFNEVADSYQLEDYNAGDYTLSGTIDKPIYKYSAFYDKLHLDAVQYEVKSPIMPGLYTSMKGDAANLIPVDKFTSLDEAWAIGFLMPKVVPAPASDLLSNDYTYTIGINIPDWTLSTDGDARGLGVIDNGSGNYTLGTQENVENRVMLHPRHGWTYKIKWASIAGDKIVPSLTGDKGDETKDTDHYFIYDGTIDKSVEIPTPYTETPLNIDLDFYTENNVDFSNLKFGETKFYLKATIPSNIPAGKQILLNLDTSEGRSGINEHQSRNAESSNGISYHYNDSEVVDGLVITTVENQTDYLMCWQYVRSDANNTNDVTITYTVTSDKHTLEGEKNASITIKGNSQAVDNPLSIDLDFYAAKNGDQNFDYGNSFTDLLLNTSHVYLKAKISSEDAAKYDGKQVILTGTYPSQNAEIGGLAIHWVDSKKSGNNNDNIWYTNNTGESLQFNVHSGILEYLIEWVFVTGGHYTNGQQIGFTYNILENANSPVKYNLIGDTQATIAFTNESQILVATNGNQASNNINLSLEYGDNSAEEFTVDVPVPNNVSGINISAPNYLAVSIGKLAAAGGLYPEVAVAVNGNYKFTDSDNTTAPRFKFKLNGTPTENPSVITFTSADGNASKATVTVNWTQRGTESNQTTIWSGAMDLQWTQNYLETTTNQLPAGTQVTLNFTTINGQNGQIKLHDSGGSQIASEDIQGITYDSNNGVSVGNAATQLTFTLQNAVNGLKINGNNVRMTSIVVYGGSTSNESVVYTGPFTFTSWDQNVTVSGTYSMGTKITLKFGNGGIMKIFNGGWKMLNIPSLSNRYPQDSHNLLIEVADNEEISFVVSSDIRLQTMNYESGELTSDELIGEVLNGIVIQGIDGVVLESITTSVLSQ